jgi:ERI1 exoribonuclease 3
MLDLEERHHSGIDDCKNISRMVTKMREEKWNPVENLS